MSRVEFFVPGVPAPQGSKTKWGTEANPRTRPWRATVAWHAADAYAGQPPMLGEIRVYANFKFPRPKSHLTAKGELRRGARWAKTSKPDLDKLLRALLDGLTDGGVFRDDAQVAYVSAWKHYSDQPGVSVDVREDLAVAPLAVSEPLVEPNPEPFQEAPTNNVGAEGGHDES